MTNGDLTSRIVNDIRALNKDEHISRRFILEVARNKSTFYLAQKLRDRSLFREENIFSTIRCLGLQKDNIIKCDIVEFRRCSDLMKSKEKLPDLLYSRYGNSIISVTTVDGMIEYLPITLSKYRLNKKRPHSKYVTQKYYYIQDGYLYLPDSEIEVVDVTLITLDTETVDEISECQEGDCCKSVWEREFICSDKMLEIVIRETLQEITSTFKQIIPDENPNMSEALRDRTER